MIELKTCPFCGGKAKLKGYQIDFRVMCPECGGRAKLCSTAEEAIEAWNRRAETVKEQPTDDVVEVRRGKWIDCVEKISGKIQITCSQCGRFLSVYLPYNFCPNCGARRDGET